MGLEVFIVSTNVRKENYLAADFIRKMRQVTLERIVTDFIMTVKDAEHFLLPTDAHNVKKRRVIKTF